MCHLDPDDTRMKCKHLHCIPVVSSFRFRKLQIFSLWSFPSRSNTQFPTFNLIKISMAAEHCSLNRTTLIIGEEVIWVVLLKDSFIDQRSCWTLDCCPKQSKTYFQPLVSALGWPWTNFNFQTNLMSPEDTLIPWWETAAISLMHSVMVMVIIDNMLLKALPLEHVHAHSAKCASRQNKNQVLKAPHA